MLPDANERILDIGTSDDTGVESNMLEQLYPHPDKITCASLTDGRAILQKYKDVRHVKIEAGRPLPFDDLAFDIVYSNAVLEHAGAQDAQRRFIEELCRVGRRRFVVVPNRLFPIEHHTCLPLVHYLPKAWFRKLLRNTRFDVWSYEDNLNYISPANLRAMWPANASLRLVYSGIGFGIWKSNLVAYQK